MSTSKNLSKLAKKSSKVSSVNKKTKNDNPRHSSHEADLTWIQRAKLVQKKSLMTIVGSSKLSRVRNKNAAIFHLELVKHLPFTEICTSLHEQYKETNPDYLEIVF
jgi:hypothetical protein